MATPILKRALLDQAIARENKRNERERNNRLVIAAVSTDEIGLEVEKMYNNLW